MTGKKELRSAIGVVGLVVALAALTLTVVWAQESQTVGTDGGTLSFDDGNVMVRVPQGAASGDISISYSAMTAEEAAEALAAAPEGTSFGSRIFALGVSPDAALDQLAEITVSYTGDDVDAAGGRDDNVGLYIYDPAFGAWNLNSAAVRDYVNQTLTSTQTNLSVTMAIIAMPPEGVEPIVEETMEMPETGGAAPGTGTLGGIAVLGTLLALGGGYLYIRGRRASAA